MYKLKIDNPNLTPGTEVEIAGLGTFKNGKEYTIEDEAAEYYRVAHPVAVEGGEQYTEDGSLVTAAYELGPTLLQAFKDDESIIVTTVKKKAPEKAEKEDAEPEKLPLGGEASAAASLSGDLTVEPEKTEGGNN